MAEQVFGYGSLVARAGGAACELRGHRRLWGVAMDNARTIPGYKVYLDADGRRPDVCVAFLDVEPCTGAALNGTCVPVDAATLEALDRRERNYVRADVTDAVAGAPPGRVWTYAGRADARVRLRDARERGRAVVAGPYARAVRDAFAALGPGALARYEATTLPHGLPELELLRRDLPG
jgi:hypothetical protein